METLMLYVDRRYVIGVQCIDGIPKSIDLPNHEERVWLYFFEDIDHDKIVYGKNNESHFLNNDQHYFGDVFPKILDSRNEFTRFRRKKPLRDIFYESRIFEDLRNPFSEREIETFVSFSTDVPLAARSVFLEELAEAGFSVKISVARIEHLSLENARNKNQIVDEGQYLVLNACNENLHYSLYDYSGGLFVRMDEDKLEGLGADLRGRALVEEVVKKANIGNHYLETTADFDYEYQRMTQLFLNKWIVKLDNAKQNIPFALDNVWFANAPNNKQTIQIKKKDIDEHTKTIVDDIVKELGRFISKSGDKERLYGLILLGDTFSNSMFEKALYEQFNFASKPIVRYRISEIKDIVSTYLDIDCEQFSADTKMFSNNAEAERIRIENAIREEVERLKAAKEQEEREQKERAAYDAEKMYNVEMQGVNEYETKKDYVRMLESCEAALKHKPNDPEALKKKKEAERCIAQEDVKSEQYNNAIKKAKECYDAGQYKEALFHSESALTLRPDSSEAKRIKDNSQNVIDTQVRIEKFSTRADLFIGQKLYDQALSELEKILTVDPDNKIAKKKRNEIKSIQQKTQKERDDLVNQFKDAELSGDFNSAIAVCEKLKVVDSINSSSWALEIKRLKEESEKKAKEKVLLAELRNNINSAVFEEKWVTVAELCNKSLMICSDDSINTLLKRAQKKMKDESDEKRFQDELVKIKTYIDEKKWGNAENSLSQLQKQFPDRSDICKKYRVIIFNEQDNDDSIRIISPNNKVANQSSKGDSQRIITTRGIKSRVKNDLEGWDWPDKSPSKKIITDNAKKDFQQSHNQKIIDKNDFFEMESFENIHNNNKIVQKSSKTKSIHLTKSDIDFFDEIDVGEKKNKFSKRDVFAERQIEDDFFSTNTIDKGKLQFDEVYSSIFAPAEVKCNSHILIQVYLHLIEGTGDVVMWAKETDNHSERRNHTLLNYNIKKGEKVDVTLHIWGETLLLSDEKTIVWHGISSKCEFDYFVPRDYKMDELLCVALLAVNGIPVGEMKFIVKIVDNPRKVNSNIIAHKYSKVFVSYSHLDESKVLFIHEGLEMGGIPHFFDRHYLKPGDVFPKVINDYINSADLFVLCWSKNAASSEYVKKELQQALGLATRHSDRLSIWPLSIEPRAELPIDMKNYHFKEV